MAAKRSDPAGVRNELTRVPELKLDSHTVRFDFLLGELDSNGGRGVAVIVVDVPLEKVGLAHIALAHDYDWRSRRLLL
jgi:hypothetical protein